MIIAGLGNLLPDRSKRKSKRDTGFRQQQSGKTVDGFDSSYATERRLWLHALFHFFGERALADVGQLVWRFLDDHPKSVRLLAFGGRSWDVALRPLLQAVPQQPSPQVDSTAADMHEPSEPLGLLRDGEIAVQADGPDLVVTDLTDQSGSSRVLHGHERDVTCFSLGEGGLMATGSADMTVRIWDAETCIQTLTSMEWSEWTGTIILGHQAEVSAVLLHPDGFTISGDIFGAICAWRSDGICSMLDPPARSAVTCLAAVPDKGMFLAGHACGELRLVSLDGLELVALWRGASKNSSRSGPVFAMTALDSGSSGSDALAACRYGLFQAWHGADQLSKLASFVDPAVSASFHGGMVMVCGRQNVSLFELDGRLRAVLSAPGAGAAALFRGIKPQPQQQQHQEVF